jgi:phosphate uptake regulator
MALSPLFCLRQPVEQTVAHAARCIKKHASDRIREAELLTVLALFGKLTRPNFDPLNVIGREAMKESKFYQDILDEGGANAFRIAVLEVLATRFGKASLNALKDSLQAVSDADDFPELLRGAARCRTIAGFRKLLARKVKSQPTS